MVNFVYRIFKWAHPASPLRIEQRKQAKYSKPIAVTSTLGNKIQIALISSLPGAAQVQESLSPKIFIGDENVKTFLTEEHDHLTIGSSPRDSIKIIDSKFPRQSLLITPNFGGKSFTLHHIDGRNVTVVDETKRTLTLELNDKMDVDGSATIYFPLNIPTRTEKGDFLQIRYECPAEKPEQVIRDLGPFLPSEEKTTYHNHGKSSPEESTAKGNAASVSPELDEDFEVYTRRWKVCAGTNDVPVLDFDSLFPEIRKGMVPKKVLKKYVPNIAKNEDFINTWVTQYFPVKGINLDLRDLSISPSILKKFIQSLFSEIKDEKQLKNFLFILRDVLNSLRMAHDKNEKGEYILEAERCIIISNDRKNRRSFINQAIEIIEKESI